MQIRNGNIGNGRISGLFVLVCVCFSFTSVYVAYDAYFRDYIEVDTDTEKSLNYEDFRGMGNPVIMDHQHGPDDVDQGIANELYNKVRVLCWIMTSPKNLQLKATAVKNTWAKRCNKYIFFSSETNHSFPTVGLNVSEGREHLTRKTVQGFLYCFKKYGQLYDWFVKADDDTYMIVENLRYFLSHQSPEQLVYFGHKFKSLVKQGYFSGGAGYVLSRGSLNKLAKVGLKNPFICRQDGGAEDAEIGKCMEKLDIKAGDSLDIYGRESFHPFKPIAHLEGQVPDWFYNYSYHGVKKGLSCCSDYSVSFHYMSPSDMYLMDYLLYHLRPYGLHPKDSTKKIFVPFKDNFRSKTKV